MCVCVEWRVPGWEELEQHDLGSVARPSAQGGWLEACMRGGVRVCRRLQVRPTTEHKLRRSSKTDASIVHQSLREGTRT